jgi:hypothetical protein
VEGVLVLGRSSAHGRPGGTVGKSGPCVPTRIRAGDKGDRLGDGSVYLEDSQAEEDIEEELERSRPAVALEETVWRGRSTEYAAVTWRWCC